MGNLGNETVVSYQVGEGKRVDVVGCWDGETPENEYDFYDLYIFYPNQLEGKHLNPGDAWYGSLPTREEVLEYLLEV